MIKLASYVAVISQTKQGHMGKSTSWGVKVVTPDLIFFPVEGQGYSSPMDMSEQRAMEFGQRIADALELDLQVNPN